MRRGLLEFYRGVLELHRGLLELHRGFLEFRRGLLRMKFCLAMPTSCCNRIEWEIFFGCHSYCDEYGKVFGGLHKMEVYDFSR